MYKEVKVGILVLSILMALGIVFILKNEEKNKPKYYISQDNGHYYTDKYTTDSIGCIHFNCKLSGYYRGITLCGKYSIQEKIK